MATNFPTSLDNFSNPTSNDPLSSPSHSGQHSDANDAIEALEARVGITGSAVTSSHSYKIGQLETNSATKTGTETLTNKTLTSPILNQAILVSAEERWSYSTAGVVSTPGATSPIYVLTSSVWYYSGAAAGNWVFNITGNASGTTLNSILAVGDSITVTVIVYQTTAYYATAYQIDGSAITPKWQGNTAPAAGNANSNDIYTFTIVKTAASTFSTFASRTRFGP